MISVGEQERSEGYPNCVTGISLMVQPHSHLSLPALWKYADTSTHRPRLSSSELRASAPHSLHSTPTLIVERQQQINSL